MSFNISDFPSLTPSVMAEMPAEKLARLREEIIETLNTARIMAEWADRAIELKYGEQLDELRRQAGNDAGIAQLIDGDVTIVVDDRAPKRRYQMTLADEVA